MTRFTRVLAAGAAAAALAIGGLAMTAEPAAADSRGYVTKAEFRKVSKGMTKKRVQRIFDTKGKQTWFWSATRWSPAEQNREYKVKSKWGWVDVDYKKKKGVWRVTSKSAYWG